MNMRNSKAVKRTLKVPAIFIFTSFALKIVDGKKRKKLSEKFSPKDSIDRDVFISLLSVSASDFE